MQQYRAPRWLPGGHLQTIWPALFSRPVPGAPPVYRRERWDTPDGDFVDVDFVDAADPAAPLLVLFHGLEGSSRSPYALAFAHRAAALGWAYAVPHFRGCSGELNLAPRAYHSGDFEEVGWVLARLRAQRQRAAAGGGHLAGRQRAAALGRGGRRVGRGHGTRGGRGVRAGRPGGRRPCHRPRLQPAGVHAHVPAHA